MAHIVIFGAGSWGTALATVAATNGHTVDLLTKRKDHALDIRKTRVNPYLHNVVLVDNIDVSSDEDFIRKRRHRTTDVIILATPVHDVPHTLSLIQDLDPSPLLIATKGITETGELLPDVVSTLTAFDKSLVGVIGGPNIAHRLAAKNPTQSACAFPDITTAVTISQLFTNDYFFVEPSVATDATSLLGAVKNVLAIGSGMCESFGWIGNTQNLLLGRGLHEIQRLLAVLTTDSAPLFSPAGVPDLSLTMLSQDSRNYRFGKLLAEGRSTEDAVMELNRLDEMRSGQKVHRVVEGIAASVGINAFATRHHIREREIPALSHIHRVIAGRLTPRDGVEALLSLYGSYIEAMVAGLSS